MHVIVETDNFGGDYPNECFLTKTDSKGTSQPIYYASKARAQQVADLLNGPSAELNSRWWKVELMGYALRPGFEP